MSKNIPLLLMLAALTTACTPWLGRGQFELVSSEADARNRYEVLSTTPVSGEGCFTGRQADDLIFSWAVQDALANADIEGATALLDATYSNHIEDKGSCLQVTGLPARLK